MRRCGMWYVKKCITEPFLRSKTWDSQVTDLIYLKESDTLVALCDQWWIPDKQDINKSRYLLLPVELDPKTSTARMIFRKEWSPLRGLE